MNSNKLDDQSIIIVQIPKTRSIVSTSDGLLLRRRLSANGRPESVPFYPHEFIQRQSAMGLVDPSAIPIASLTVDDLNPLERQRIRESIRRYGGDMSLLPLANEELDSALGLRAYDVTRGESFYPRVFQTFGAV